MLNNTLHYSQYFMWCLVFDVGLDALMSASKCEKVLRMYVGDVMNTTHPEKQGFLMTTYLWPHLLHMTIQFRVIIF